MTWLYCAGRRRLDVADDSRRASQTRRLLLARAARLLGSRALLLLLLCGTRHGKRPTYARRRTALFRGPTRARARALACSEGRLRIVRQSSPRRRSSVVVLRPYRRSRDRARRDRRYPCSPLSPLRAVPQRAVRSASEGKKGGSFGAGRCAARVYPSTTRTTGSWPGAREDPYEGARRGKEGGGSEGGGAEGPESGETGERQSCGGVIDRARLHDRPEM